MDNKCAPGKDFKEGSCFTFDDLKELAEAYNKAHADKISVDDYKTKKALLKELIKRFKEQYECDDQVCWLGTKVGKKISADIKEYTFRPTGPEEKYGWLSTEEIENVMKQYEKIHTDFKFLGAVPSDFDEIPAYETTDLQFSKLETTTPKLGLVINLDTHDMSGSHWVALYANLKTNTIYYFDSFKKPPQNRVRTFVTRLLSYMANKSSRKLDIKKFMEDYQESDEFDVRYNKIQHQYKNSECGVYSIHFLIKLLEGNDFDKIVNNIIDDATMNKYRHTIFRNSNK